MFVKERPVGTSISIAMGKKSEDYGHYFVTQDSVEFNKWPINYSFCIMLIKYGFYFFPIYQESKRRKINQLKPFDVLFLSLRMKY